MTQNIGWGILTLAAVWLAFLAGCHQGWANAQRAATRHRHPTRFPPDHYVKRDPL